MKETTSILSNVNQLTQYVLDACNTFETEQLNKVIEVLMKQQSSNKDSMLVYKHIIEREIAWRVRYANLNKELNDKSINYEKQIEDINIELNNTKNKVQELTEQTITQENTIVDLTNTINNIKDENTEIQKVLEELQKTTKSK